MNRPKIIRLSWISHNAAFSSIIPSFRAKNVFCDVTIFCNGSYFQAHRLILATYSDYFREILEVLPTSHPYIAIQDVHVDDLKDLLDFIYVGEASVASHRMDSFLKAAKNLKVRGLGISNTEDADPTFQDFQHKIVELGKRWQNMNGIERPESVEMDRGPPSSTPVNNKDKCERPESFEIDKGLPSTTPVKTKDYERPEAFELDKGLSSTTPAKNKDYETPESLGLDDEPPSSTHLKNKDKYESPKSFEMDGIEILQPGIDKVSPSSAVKNMDRSEKTEAFGIGIYEKQDSLEMNREQPSSSNAKNLDVIRVGKPLRKPQYEKRTEPFASSSIISAPRSTPPKPLSQYKHLTRGMKQPLVVINKCPKAMEMINSLNRENVKDPKNNAISTKTGNQQLNTDDFNEEDDFFKGISNDGDTDKFHSENSGARGDVQQTRYSKSTPDIKATNSKTSDQMPSSDDVQNIKVEDEEDEMDGSTTDSADGSVYSLTDVEERIDSRERSESSDARGKSEVSASSNVRGRTVVSVSSCAKGRSEVGISHEAREGIESNGINDLGESSVSKERRDTRSRNEASVNSDVRRISDNKVNKGKWISGVSGGRSDSYLSSDAKERIEATVISDDKGRREINVSSDAGEKSDKEKSMSRWISDARERGDVKGRSQFCLSSAVKDKIETSASNSTRGRNDVKDGIEGRWKRDSRRDDCGSCDGKEKHDTKLSSDTRENIATRDRSGDREKIVTRELGDDRKKIISIFSVDNKEKVVVREISVDWEKNVPRNKSDEREKMLTLDRSDVRGKIDARMVGVENRSDVKKISAGEGIADRERVGARVRFDLSVKTDAREKSAVINRDRNDERERIVTSDRRDNREKIVNRGGSDGKERIFVEDRSDDRDNIDARTVDVENKRDIGEKNVGERLDASVGLSDNKDARNKSTDKEELKDTIARKISQPKNVISISTAKFKSNAIQKSNLFNEALVINEAGVIRGARVISKDDVKDTRTSGDSRLILNQNIAVQLTKMPQDMLLPTVSIQESNEIGEEERKADEETLSPTNITEDIDCKDSSSASETTLKSSDRDKAQLTKSSESADEQMFEKSEEKKEFISKEETELGTKKKRKFAHSESPDGEPKKMEDEFDFLPKRKVKLLPKTDAKSVLKKKPKKESAAVKLSPKKEKGSIAKKHLPSSTEAGSTPKKKLFPKKEKKVLIKEKEELKPNQSLYRCHLCSFESKYFSHMKVHERLHSGEKPYKCELCPYMSAYKNSLTKHMQTHKIQCPLCRYEAKGPADLEEHQRFHVEDTIYACTQCSYVCTRALAFKNHAKLHTETIKPRSRPALKLTAEQTVEQMFCDQSSDEELIEFEGFDSFDDTSLRELIEAATEETVGEASENVEESLPIKNDANEIRHCSECEFETTDAFDFEDHKKTHLSTKTYKCKFCPYKIKNLARYKKHMMVHKAKSKSWKHHCDYCSFSASSKHKLIYHMNMHEDKKPHKCKLCSYKSRSKSNLKAHIGRKHANL